MIHYRTDKEIELLRQAALLVGKTLGEAMSRKSIEKRVVTGVRAIDSLLAVGEGQRLGIFAGSAVGYHRLK